MNVDEKIFISEDSKPKVRSQSALSAFVLRFWWVSLAPIWCKFFELRFWWFFGGVVSVMLLSFPPLV
jgi:hypothetical protein